MSATAFKGDYLGFTYNGKHSSEFGIVRVSDGSRFNENLLPTMQDKTAQVPGGDGTYYFGSYYTQRQFNVSFAFDSLTENQLASLRTHFGDKGIHDLIFDEVPYKVYSAKVTGTATLKYIPFAEGETNRVYKGEGSIQFTCYDPFARCRFMTRSQYEADDCTNIDEWWDAAGLGKDSNVGNKIINVKNSSEADSEASLSLYNPGDIDCHFMVRIPFGTDSHTVPAGKLRIGTSFLSWNLIERKNNESGIYIDSKTNLIIGYNKTGTEEDPIFTKTSTIYNDCLDDGEFFKIPRGKSTLILVGLFGPWKEIRLSYNYLYF